MDEALAEFLRENLEGLTNMEADLSSLREKGKAVSDDDPELFGRLYRVMHTIAGTAGFLGFDKLGQLGASSELLIAAMKEGDFEIKSHMIDALHVALGKAREILNHVQKTEQEGDTDCTEIIATFAKIQKDEGGVEITEQEGMMWLE